MKKLMCAAIFVSSAAHADFDNWTTYIKESACLIDAGMVAVHGKEETRVIAKFIIPRKTSNESEKLGLKIGVTHFILESVDETLAAGYEVIIEAGGQQYRAFPVKNQEKMYSLSPAESASLLSQIERSEVIKMAFRLRDGKVCVIATPSKPLLTHYGEIKNCEISAGT